MSVQQPAHNRVNCIEVASDADVGVGAPVSLSGAGYPASVIGFSGVADPYRNYNEGDVLISKVTGGVTRIYQIAKDAAGTPGTKVAIQVYSSAASATPSADIVFVVAQAPKYGAVPMSSFVFTSLTAAIAAAAAVGGATIMLLDDTYSAGATINLPNNTRLTGLSGNPSAVVLTTSLFLSSSVLTVATGATVSLSNLTISPVASDQGIACLGAATVRLDNVRVSSGNGSFVGAGGVTTLVADRTLFGSSPASITMTVAGSSAVLTDCQATGSVTVNGAGTTLSLTNTSVTGAVTSQELATTTSAFVSNVTAAGTVVDAASTFGAGLTVGAASTLTGTRVGASLVAGDNATLNNVYVGGVLTTGINAFLRDTSAGGNATFGADAIVLDGTFFGTFNGGDFTAINTRHRGRVNVANNGNATMTDVYVNVSGLAAGVGAIVLGTNAALSVGGYVRGNQRISVSGDATATVVVEGEMRGGCFISTVQILETRSGVRGDRVGTGTIPAASTQTIQTTTAINEVVDTVLVDPLGIGATLEIYSAATVPDGKPLVVKNIAAGLVGLLVVAAVGESIDGVVAPAGKTLGPGDFLSLQRISSTAWTTSA